jgi:two-component system sensor histidine kinase KdpD
VILLSILGVAFVISMRLQEIVPSQQLVSMLLVLAVFLVSLFTQGYFWGILASIFSVLIDNFVFTYPYFAFDFISTENFIAAVVMLIVAVVTGTLTQQLKEQERIWAEAEKEKMRGNLLRAISHDLRTPLTTIYGSTSLIIDSYDSLPREQQLKLLGQVREDADSLIRMVENLLSVTRVNAGTVQISKEPTVLEELIDASLTKFSKHYPNQTVQVDIPEDFISIPMDAMLIQQVILNILGNAVLHARGMTELKLRVYTEGDNAVFEITDNGCGIPRDRLDQLFTGQLYGRQEPGDDRRHGMGIGLGVCRTIIKAHGGEITAENLRSGGACFRFTLEMEKENHE